MKITNADAPGSKANRATRGMVSTNVAGSKGMVWRDASSESVGQIRDMTVVGATFTDNEDGTGVLTIGDEAGVPGSGGSIDIPVEHGNMGATETISLLSGNVHRGTLNADCAITIEGFTAGQFAPPLLFEVAQNGTGGFDITWDGDVAWYGDDQPEQAATDISHFVFFGMDGDGTIYGFKVGGGGSSVGALDDLSDVVITAAAEDDQLQYVGGQWVNNARRWEPVTTNPGTGPELVWDGDDIVMTWASY